MRVQANYKGASRSLTGDLNITFSVDDDSNLINELEGLKTEDLALEVSKYRNKRSVSANAYLWKLCDMIAKAIGSDKDTVYLMELRDHGVFVDLSVVTEAITVLRREFRYVELLDDGYGETTTARCYFGSSKYDTKEMSDLINGVVNHAHDIGLSTWDQAEIDSLIANWKGE